MPLETGRTWYVTMGDTPFAIAALLLLGGGWAVGRTAGRRHRDHWSRFSLRSPLYHPGISVLFLCTGNQCRSPMAAALLRARLAQRASAIAVDSAGFVSEGMPPPKEVLDAMSAVGLDLSDHRSRLVRPDMIKAADLVIGMTRQHVIDAALLAPGVWTRCFTAADLGSRGETVGPRLPGEESAFVGQPAPGRPDPGVHHLLAAGRRHR